MPSVITASGTPVVPTGLTVPSDGDTPIRASDLIVPVQGLLDGEADLNARAIRPYATVAALQASTVHADGSFAAVLANGGLYRYSSASSVTARANIVITPTDVGGGAGRWLLLLPTDVANGIPTLDASTKVTASQVPMRLVSAQQAALATTFATGSTTVVDTGLSLSVSATAGDLLVIDAPVPSYSSGAGAVSAVSLVIVDGSAVVVSTILFPASGNQAVIQALSALYTVTTTGTITVKVQVIASAGSTVFVVGGSSAASVQSRIRSLQYRP